MDKIEEGYVNGLKTALWNSYKITDATRWIQDHTFLGGDRFSFRGHEYQKQIIDDPSRVLNVQKAAQVGMSELMARYVLALCRIIPGFSAIITMPFSGDAESFMKTRVNPIIRDSRELSENLNYSLDNTEMKGIGTSLLYMRGTSGTTQALSIPADLLVHDELDKSDVGIIGQYQSRIRHSSYKLVRKFSTPTLAKRGISAEMGVSRRKHNVCNCNHCGFSFVPDYFEHVAIPGYSGDIREVTIDTITKLRWREAVLLCPKCGKEPSLLPEHREWVVENSDDNYEAVGYFVSPFDVPSMTTIPGLVSESTRYENYSEFMNQALGLVANNSNEQITEQDLRDSRVTVPLESSNIHCMGVDMGLTVNILIGRLQDGMLLVIHREQCLLGVFPERKLILQAKYKVLMTVCDSQPYVDLILRLQQNDKNLFGGVYHSSKDLAVYSIKKVDKNDAKGKLPINQALINRDIAFDEIMGLFKSVPRRIVWQAISEEADNQFIAHCLDMRRVQKKDQYNELRYSWEKSHDGVDHQHHALLYLYTACRLLSTFDRTLAISGVDIPIIKKFDITQPDDPRSFHNFRV